MDYLVDQKAVSTDTRKTLLTNQLVLVVPSASAVAPITLNGSWDIKKALGDGRLAVADPDHVPAGRYAMQSLKFFDLWQQAAPLLARASNVRAALALVERGEASMGIVYLTDTYTEDANAPKKVKVIARIPQNTHQPIEYPAVLVREKSSDTVRAFFQYLQSDKAKAIFIKYGFGVLDAQ
ncbi:molybdate ABC transporter substrate-binding protein [Veronia nyctiphanis]|uniref:molybdate ABC transporter substrate-binding protein n=1 Tax=Veronia nyctiphanis TaxID=1278244 RepID=UPI002E26E47A